MKEVFQLSEVGVLCRMGADENHTQNRKFKRQGMAAESSPICSGNVWLYGGGQTNWQDTVIIYGETLNPGCSSSWLKESAAGPDELASI